MKKLLYIHLPESLEGCLNGDKKLTQEGIKDAEGLASFIIGQNSLFIYVVSYLNDGIEKLKECSSLSKDEIESLETEFHNVDSKAKPNYLSILEKPPYVEKKDSILYFLNSAHQQNPLHILFTRIKKSFVAAKEGDYEKAESIAREYPEKLKCIDFFKPIVETFLNLLQSEYENNIRLTICNNDHIKNRLSLAKERKKLEKAKD